MNRSKRAIYNAASALLLQGILIIVNFIIPRFIIAEYGSATNGLISSITKFLGYIALLEGGIGGVIKAILYKSLAKKDEAELSTIMATLQGFFRKICVGLIAYVTILCIVFPIITSSEFDHLFTISLVIIIAFGSLAQYFFGFASQLLLQSDQRGYIVSFSRAIAYIVSTVIVVLLILLKVDVRIAEMSIIVVMSIPPIFQYIFVKKHYHLPKGKADKTILSRRWDGFAHQISAFIHSNTDIALLSLFATMSEVSVYTVYAMVASGIRSIINTLSNSLSATFGNIYASNEQEKLSKHFRVFSYFSILIIFFVFTLAALLVTPFVQIYTSGVHDANYNQPVFGVLIVIAEAIYCLRVVYSDIIFAVGDFRQTKAHGFIEAALNIIVSLSLIQPLGLTGIAIGTVVGMLYRCIASIIYVHKHIIQLNIRSLIKKFSTNIAATTIFIIAALYLGIFSSAGASLTNWLFSAIIGSVLFAAIIILTNLVFCRKDIAALYQTYIKLITSKLRRRKL